VSTVCVWGAGSELAQPTSAIKLMQIKSNKDFMPINIKFFIKKDPPQSEQVS
jgi:hypothetical protein